MSGRWWVRCSLQIDGLWNKDSEGRQYFNNASGYELKAKYVLHPSRVHGFRLDCGNLPRAVEEVCL